jgi:hypothetical protein
MRKIIASIFVFVCSFFLFTSSVDAVSAPEGVNAVNTGSGEVTVYWDYADNVRAKGYNISYGIEEVDQYGILGVGEDRNIMMSYTVKGLHQGQEYCFAVSTQTEEMASEYSEVDCVVVGSGYQTSTHVYVDENGRALENQPVVEEHAGMPKEASDKYQGTMETDAGLREAEITTGRKGAGEYNLRAVKGDETGEVTLFWNRGQADDYHLLYTDEKGEWKFGQLNIGDETAAEVKDLSSGHRYWFALVPIKDGRVQAETVTVSEIAK